MRISRKENFVLVKNEKMSLTDFSSKLTKLQSDFKNDNVIVDLLKYEDLDSKYLLSFLEISNLHRKGNKSFVIVNDAVGIDELPEELIVVPTLQEAEDMIQMDEIQRELGF